METRSRGPRSGPGSPPSLAALVAQLERRAAESEAINATAPVAAVLRNVIIELHALDGAATDPAPAAPAADRLLTAQEAARLLGVAPKWLYRHGTLPFVRRLGPHLVRFDEGALRKWLARR